MKISIEEISREMQEEILIRCHEVDEEIYDIISKLESEPIYILGYQNESVYRINIKDIYYFEAVDGKVFLYCKNTVYEVKEKLYELEALCKDRNCFRASKSTILNLTKISSVRPSISGRFEAILDNGERTIISRQYVPVLKTMLGL